MCKDLLIIIKSSGIIIKIAFSLLTETRRKKKFNLFAILKWLILQLGYTQSLILSFAMTKIAQKTLLFP